MCDSSGSPSSLIYLCTSQWSVKDRCALSVGEQQPVGKDDAVFEDPSVLQSFPRLVVLSLLFVGFCRQIREESYFVASMSPPFSPSQLLENALSVLIIQPSHNDCSWCRSRILAHYPMSSLQDRWRYVQSVRKPFLHIWPGVKSSFFLRYAQYVHIITAASEFYVVHFNS